MGCHPSHWFLYFSEGRLNHQPAIILYGTAAKLFQMCSRCKLLNALYSRITLRNIHVYCILCIYIYIYIHTHVFKLEWCVSTHNYLHIKRLESQVNCSYEKWPAFLLTSYYGVFQDLTTYSGNHYQPSSTGGRRFGAAGNIQDPKCPSSHSQVPEPTSCGFTIYQLEPGAPAVMPKTQDRFQR